MSDNPIGWANSTLRDMLNYSYYIVQNNLRLIFQYKKMVYLSL